MDAPTLQSGSSLCPINVDVIAASSRVYFVWLINKKTSFMLYYYIFILSQNILCLRIAEHMAKEGE